MSDILVSKEITYDYAINGYYDGDLPKCTCGSSRCRKILNCNFFKLPKALQKEYLPYLDDWFVKEFKDKLAQLINFSGI